MASPVWSDDEILSDSSCVAASSDDETFVFTPKKRRYRRSLFERKRRRQTNSRAAEIINKDKTLNKDCVDCNNNDNRHNVDMDDSFNDGMAKCLPDLVKSVKDKADETVKKLVQRLSNTIVREHGDSSVRGLGARKNHVLTDAEQDLLAVDDEQHEQLYKYFRVQTVNNQVIYSKEYKRVKNKNSYTVIYVKDDNQQENKYGSVEYFLEISGNMYAVIKIFHTTEKSLHDFRSVKEGRLARYNNFNLCPHIVQVEEVQENHRELVPVENIKQKCVHMVFGRRFQYLSYPPNLLEHD